MMVYMTIVVIRNQLRALETVASLLRGNGEDNPRAAITMGYGKD
jgi:hypothetical protein